MDRRHLPNLRSFSRDFFAHFRSLSLRNPQIPRWEEQKLVMISPNFWLFSLKVTIDFSQFLIIFIEGHDPDWSISKALASCEKPSWIYLNTTPFYALCRYAGCAIGKPKSWIDRFGMTMWKITWWTFLHDLSMFPGLALGLTGDSSRPLNTQPKNKSERKPFQRMAVRMALGKGH